MAYVATSMAFLNRYMIAFALAASILNTTITTLIVCRIWYHQSFIKSALGSGYTATYMRLIHLFVESAAIIVVFNVTHVILAFWPKYMVIFPHQLLVHVYVSRSLIYIICFGSNHSRNRSFRRS